MWTRKDTVVRKWSKLNKNVEQLQQSVQRSRIVKLVLNDKQKLLSKIDEIKTVKAKMTADLRDNMSNDKKQTKLNKIN